MNEAEGLHTHQAVERLALSLTGSVTAEGFVVYALRAYKDTLKRTQRTYPLYVCACFVELH